MRKTVIILTVVVLACWMIVNLNVLRLPQEWSIGPSQAFGDDNTKTSMPNEATGFSGTLLGEVADLKVNEHRLHDPRLARK